MSESWVLLPDSEIRNLRQTAEARVRFESLKANEHRTMQMVMSRRGMNHLALELVRLNPEGREPETETQWGHGLGGIDPVRPMPEEAARFMAFGQGHLYKRTIQVGPWAVVYEGAET